MRLLPLLIVPALLLAGCSSAPLAADQAPDRPSEVVAREDQEAGDTLTLSSIPGAPVADAPDVKADCLVVFSEEDVSAISHGQLTLEWTPESPLATQLQATVRGGSSSPTASGTSPLTLAWTEADGPAMLPFLVQVTLPDGAFAALQEVEATVKVDAPQAIEAFAWSCDGIALALA